MKSLAVVGRVIETADIQNADRIIQARVYCAEAGTWSGVVGKGMQAEAHGITENPYTKPKPESCSRKAAKARRRFDAVRSYRP